MDRAARSRPIPAALVATSAILAALGPALVARGDSVLLKDGTVYHGAVDKDNTLVFVSDNLKRTIFYNSKIGKIESDPGFSQMEGFKIYQPLEVHAGVMPPAAVNIRATPWDSKGRRMFSYVNNRQKTVTMQQAIHVMRPYMVEFRGIDGFWQGQIATSQIPREVILGMLARVDRTILDERLKIVRWLIQARWYAEALAAIDGVLKDFPDDKNLKESMEDTRRLVRESEAFEALNEVAVRRKSLQPSEVRARLRSIPAEGLPRVILDDVRAQLRKDDDQAVVDRLLGDSLRDLSDRLSEADQKAWKGRLAEVLEVLAKAPDAARPRLDALAKADASASPEARFALAMSGWVVGPDAAVDSPHLAGELWRARSILRDYLASKDEAARASLLDDLQKVEGLELEKVARIVVRMDPPLRDPDPSHEKPGFATIHRVVEDENPVPTEYAALLPPEYHPSRDYPAVVALHDGHGPKAATEWLAAEAARRGYIVIAPEYNLPGKGQAYHYSTDEHAAVELSLRDARKRYAIDSDRVYLAGQLEGANMAWDFGLAHPDLFAGVVSISGFPAKYAYKYKPQSDKVPMYIALGEQAPAAREVVFDQYVKPMIQDVQDVTYVDYIKRGLEELPEEVPTFFDWMDRRRRDPYPKSFEAAVAREGDDRFFGVVVREIAPGRTTSPEAADVLGKNLRPATIKMRSSTQGNLINLTVSGINRLDVWLSPRLIDFKRKVEVRVNEKAVVKAMVPLEFAPMLEDLRFRGDRQQLYYARVSWPAAARPKGR